MSEGILVTPTMMAHHRLFVLADAFKVSSPRAADKQPNAAKAASEFLT